MGPITFICWKWKPARLYHKQFRSDHVNALYDMLKQYYDGIFKLVCITDDPIGIKDNIAIMPIWDDYVELGGCYRRLKIFDPEINKQFGKYIVNIDLDCVIVGNITNMIQDKIGENLTLWRRKNNYNQYSGAFWMLRTGTCKYIWNMFSVQKLREMKAERGDKLLSRGTDQAWISYCVDRMKLGHACWTSRDGIYDYKGLNKSNLPDNAKIVFFNGNKLMPDMGLTDWTQQYYPVEFDYA